MMQEKWKNILGNIKDNFKVYLDGQEHLDDEGGVDVEFIEFEGPLGKMRLEFISKPVVLDKKTIYSKRIGSESAVDYVYSQDERSNKLMVYKWDEGEEDWVEMEANKLGF